MQTNGLNKKIIALVVVLAAAAGIAFKAGVFSRLGQKQTANDGKVKVVASFYPLAEFSRNVGGGLADVTTITPAGAEPHDYEPTPQDIAKAYDAQLFVFNGNGLDSWADKLRPDLESHGVTVIRMADYFNSLKTNSEGLAEDPHFWLNPQYAEIETDLIADAFIKIDPAHKAEYNANRSGYKAQLSRLDQAYQTGLASCKQHEIVTSHNAFNYLARQYGFTTLYILGFSPDEEPSPQAIAATADLAKRQGIQYIFFESLVSPKLSQTIANEIGAKTLELNPIEGLAAQDAAAGKNYISVMQANLTNLKIALQCQ